MSPKFALLVSAAVLASTNLPAQAAPPAATQVQAQSEADARLLKLFHDSDEASLQRNPVNALFRGDLRYADRLGDYISDAYFAAERVAGENDLKALAAIDKTKLSPVDQIAYDVFKWQTESNLKALKPEMLALTAVRPLDQIDGKPSAALISATCSECRTLCRLLK